MLVHARPASKTPAAPPARPVAAPASQAATPFRAARRAWGADLLREPVRPGAPPVVQRVITHDGKRYRGGKRPAFTTQSESSLLKQMNEKLGTSYAKTRGPMAKHKLDRAHVVAFDTIQEWIVNHLNKPSSSFSGDVEALIARCSESERKNAQAALKALHEATGAKTPDPKAVAVAANKLRSQLNSASANLRPGEKYTNAYLGANFDPRLRPTPDGTKFQADSHTKDMIGLGYGKIGKILRTPTRGQRVVSSDQPVPFSDMSPVTRRLLEDAPWEKRQIRSEKLRATLDKAHPYARQAPRLRLNLNPAPSTSTAPPSAPSATAPSVSPQSQIKKPAPTSTTPSAPRLPFQPSMPPSWSQPFALPPTLPLPPQWWQSFHPPSHYPPPFSFAPPVPPTFGPPSTNPSASSYAPPQKLQPAVSAPTFSSPFRPSLPPPPFSHAPYSATSVTPTSTPSTNPSASSYTPPRKKQSLHGPAPQARFVPSYPSFSVTSFKPTSPPSTSPSASYHSPPPKLPPPPLSYFTPGLLMSTYSPPPSMPPWTSQTPSSSAPPKPQHSTSQSLPISSQKPTESKPSLSLSTSTAKSPGPAILPSPTLSPPPAPSSAFSTMIPVDNKPAPDPHYEFRMQRHREWLRAQAQNKQPTAPS